MLRFRFRRLFQHQVSTSTARLVSTSSQSGEVKVTVWWDSSCPLCTFEIDFMKKLDKDKAVNFIDLISTDNSTSACPIDKKEMLARFHAQETGKEIVTGAAAFAAVWRSIPATRWMGILAQNSRILSILESAYIWFLKYRPKLQNFVRKI